ncbi:hypothetical protein RCO27_04510 [Sphingosinicella sp. LHD-64]|uniref:hypothetical protein n=1 Tax=Sphingosinicella sp. LHD-64 TaxID=3072139 RepID=UPI00280F17DD|nr:hypothetical protein [Sphingosinicella sp. LHD-64]MDQ8755484.1 hypothetical protein [Sphingosinicella sp. LHD-64]
MMAGRVVNVGTGAAARAALAEPQFLIEKDGKLYLTLAVLEYDPNHPDITQQQQASVTQLQTMLGSGGLRATLLEEPLSASPTQDVALQQPQQAGMALRMVGGPPLGLQFAQTDPPPNTL